jgi:hypothetical protein
LNVQERCVLQDNLSMIPPHLLQNIFLSDNSGKNCRSSMFQRHNARRIPRRGSHNLNNTRDTFCRNLQKNMCN